MNSTFAFCIIQSRMLLQGMIESLVGLRTRRSSVASDQPPPSLFETGFKPLSVGLQVLDKVVPLSGDPWRT
ncbi:hypothetical protein HYQ45_006004 [Verticillium longisporum]|uniref:Uncharacterized protein n=1 Tax=Verticillium longisporum TaxID=100787 RepID=A0A8I2ZRX9_VERLO|nr:hypothetical protein HYQ45_006004 [Verticillium longisporum]